MPSVREQYWRYSLFVLILGMGITIFIELSSFLGGLLGAATIYVLLRRQMRLLTERRRWRRSVAASVLVGEAVLCFLVPLSLVAWLLVNRLQNLTLDPQALVERIRHFAEVVRAATGLDLRQELDTPALVGRLTDLAHWVLRSVASFSINVVTLLFVLYFMLIGGPRMERYCRDIMPFDRSVARSVMREIRLIVRSNAIVIPLLAVAQGAVAYAGYLILGVAMPLCLGLLTCFATIIPVVGTAIVWIPVAGFLVLEGRWGAGLGLALYGTIVVTQVDNVLRFVMQKRMADTHPLVTIFGVIVGLPLFGFMGVVFGPLLLSVFIFCVDMFKRKYLDAPGR